MISGAVRKCNRPDGGKRGVVLYRQAAAACLPGRDATLRASLAIRCNPLCWRTGPPRGFSSSPMRDLDDVFAALARSKFRRRFALGAKERGQLEAKGVPTLLLHAHDFIARRLAPAAPPKDGRQTPWRGHPVFVAQHATGTCCRGCLAKWHGIEAGRALSDEEEAHVLAAIGRWLVIEAARSSAAAEPSAAPSAAGRRSP
jgi:predicted Fe-S protein YdhL (DUF1289 family)